MKDYALSYSAYTTLIYNLLSLYSPNHPNTSLHHSLTSHIYEVLSGHIAFFNSLGETVY